MSVMASQITAVSIAWSTVSSGADQRIHRSSASLAFVTGIHRWPVDSPHKWPVTGEMFPFDDVIMMDTLLRPLLCEINNSSMPIKSPSKLWHRRIIISHCFVWLKPRICNIIPKSVELISVGSGPRCMVQSNSRCKTMQVHKPNILFIVQHGCVSDFDREIIHWKYLYTSFI